MEQLREYSIEHLPIIEPGRDRSEFICELVVFAEANAAELLERIYHTLNSEEIVHPAGLKWISYHSQEIFNQSPSKKQYRAAVVTYGVIELKRQLSQLVKMIEENPHQPFSYPAAGFFYGFGSPEGKLAYLFPGQGAQYSRMGKELVDIYTRSKAVWDQMGSMAYNGKTLNEVVFPPEPRDEEEAHAQAAELALTDRSLPAITMMSESILVLFEAMAVKPDAVAAHSLGDVSSYRAAGIFTSEQAIRIARARGVIASTCPMASSGGALMAYTDPETIRNVLNKYGVKDVWIVNYNAPTLNVLAGSHENLKSVKEAFARENINSKTVPINVAPHSPLALRGSNLIIEYLSSEHFNKAECDIYSYLFGSKMKNDPNLFKHVLGINLLKPVRFVEQIENMYADGVRTFVEIGPSEGLGMLVARILGDKSFRALSTNRRKGDANFHFLSSVAELIKLGRIENTKVLWEDYIKPKKPELNASADPDEEQPASRKEEADRLKTLDLELAKINSIANG